jgi:hypothetical protein
VTALSGALSARNAAKLLIGAPASLLHSNFDHEEKEAGSSQSGQGSN